MTQEYWQYSGDQGLQNNGEQRQLMDSDLNLECIKLRYFDTGINLKHWTCSVHKNICMHNHALTCLGLSIISGHNVTNSPQCRNEDRGRWMPEITDIFWVR